MDFTGLRIARWRDAAGMTQQELADRIGRSRKWLSEVERGVTPVTHRRDLYAVAAALGVSPTDLAGQPQAPRNRDELAVTALVPALRGALDDEPEDRAPLDVDGLRARVDHVMAARMGCDYQRLASLLPGVVADARRLANSVDEAAGAALFARAAVCVALTVKPFGYLDLAARFAERATLAADLLGEAAERAAARFAGAQLALASGTAGGRRRSYTLAAAGVDELDGAAGDDALTWYGMLHLHAAMSAASLGHHDDMAAHLREAEATAGRVQGDPWRMEVTPANVGVWRTNIALENGDPGRAPEFARQVDRSALRSVQRRAHLHIGAGRGLFLAGRPDAAVRQFLAADAVAPAELRTRPSVREIVAQMVRDARRQGSGELRELAVRVGVDPVDPDVDAASE